MLCPTRSPGSSVSSSTAAREEKDPQKHSTAQSGRHFLPLSKALRKKSHTRMMICHALYTVSGGRGHFFRVGLRQREKEGKRSSFGPCLLPQENQSQKVEPNHNENSKDSFQISPTCQKSSPRGKRILFSAKGRPWTRVFGFVAHGKKSARFRITQRSHKVRTKQITHGTSRPASASKRTRNKKTSKAFVFSLFLFFFFFFSPPHPSGTNLLDYICYSFLGALEGRWGGLQSMHRMKQRC
jgi:hypothetical protein